MTAIGRLPGVAFRVEGRALHYVPPFQAFVDLLEPEGTGFAGRATCRGREFGRFGLRRLADP